MASSWIATGMYAGSERVEEPSASVYSRKDRQVEAARAICAAGAMGTRQRGDVQILVARKILRRYRAGVLGDCTSIKDF